jgi:glycosyltransferase involved in cell wall biosynthesis
MGIENQENYKKRILFVGEASSLNTGFSNIYRELLPRLAATGKYEIAELGSYVRDDDPRARDFVAGRWKFYGNQPMTPEEEQIFNQADPAQPGQNTNQFGRWKFEKVLSDFRPDIVIDIRDWWMLAFQERSPFRKYFSWLIMPTVDSIPQKEEWISTFNSATYVMAYSDFGIDSLRKSSPRLELRTSPPDKPGFIGIDKAPGKLHPVPLRPGVDLKTFRPRSDEEKAALKKKWGLRPDIPIILLVQRNQARKRISEVLRSFALMKSAFPDNETVQKSILVMHTAWPDNAMSIDFPRAVARIQTGYHGVPITRKGFIREVNSTFMCHNPECGDVFIAPSINLRQHPVIRCPKCGQQSARTPTTGAGYTREQLAEVYGMADLMVQMSIAEGCGMPVQEAKACGVPVLVTDYAAISEKGRVPDYDHINKKTYSVHKGGEVMDVAYLYEEPETTCWRAHTSMEDCAKKMGELLGDHERLSRMKAEARECAEEHYDWDKTWKTWEFILDHITPLDRDETWDRDVSLIDIDMQQPDPGMTNEEFVVWCYTKLLGYSGEHDIDEDGRRTWLQKLAVELSRGVPAQKTREEVANYFRQQAEAQNQVERLRAGSKTLAPSTNEQDNGDSFEAMIV